MRRRFQFSLRTLLVLLTALAIWLGFTVNRAQVQKKAVRAIEAAGGVVQYDWQPKLKPQSGGTVSVAYQASHWTNVLTPESGQPGGPAWLRRLIGDDYFQEVESVAFVIRSTVVSHYTEEGLRKVIPNLRQLHALKAVTIEGFVSEEMMGELKAALPDCDVCQVEYGTFPKGF